MFPTANTMQYTTKKYSFWSTKYGEVEQKGRQRYGHFKTEINQIPASAPIENRTSNRNVVGSNRTMGKNFHLAILVFFFRVSCRSTKSIQMKSTMKYTYM